MLNQMQNHARHACAHRAGDAVGGATHSVGYCDNAAVSNLSVITIC